MKGKGRRVIKQDEAVSTEMATGRAVVAEIVSSCLAVPRLKQR